MQDQTSTARPRGKTGPKPSCLCGECEKCRARERWRRKFYGLPPLENRNELHRAAGRRRALEGATLRAEGVPWDEIARRVGYANGNSARSQVMACKTLPTELAVAIRSLSHARKCECLKCPTCCSREKEAARRRGDVDAYHAWARYGATLRRAHLRAHTDLTPADEMTLRMTAKRCPLCRRKLIDSPHQSRSKELDHIVPVNIGGTHTFGNVRIVCRACNAARPYDGSDLVGVQTALGSAA